MGRWTPERFTRWAEDIGPNTGALITTVLGSRRHPQQAFRSCLGILRLAKSYGDARLEAAARRALAIGANSYRSIESILNHRLDEHPPEPIEPACCFSLSLVGSPRELAGVFRRRIAWDDGAIREPAGAGAVAFVMNRCCRSGENVGARAPSVGKRWGSVSFSMACPHGP